MRAPAELAALLAVTACGFVAGLFPIFESDLFWHLAAGRWIVERGAVPRLDPFRFTSDAAPWVDHEWAFQVAVRALESVAGLDGLIVVRATALALFALAVWHIGRRGGLGAGLAGALALGVLLGVRPRFLLRPEIVTLFAIVTLLTLLERRREGRGGTVGLILLTIGWVNFHGEALLAPLLAGLFLLGAAREAPGRDLRREGRGGWLELLGLPALLACALLVNPYGWRLIEVPLGIRRAMTGLAASNPEWNTAFESPQPYLFAGIAVVAGLALAARWRKGSWPSLAFALPALAMAGLALTAVRHQALFFAAAAPFAARCLARLGQEARNETEGAARERRLALATVAAALVLAVWCAVPPASGPFRQRHGGLHWGFGLAPGRFPVHAAERIAAHPNLGPLYNELAHGGYLLWRLHPPRRVFLDGRMELEPELLGELERARSSAESWAARLGREGAVGALVRYQPRPVPLVEPDGRGGFRQVGASTANAQLFPPDRWQLADWDDEAMLFLAPNAAGWEEPPYRFVQPEDVAQTVRRAAADTSFRAAVIDELDRKLAEQPDCRRALWLRDQIALASNQGVNQGAEQGAGPDSDPR